MSPRPIEAGAPEALVTELLQWVGREPRTYAETMEAWRTSCPRLAVWEAAVRLGLVRVAPAGGRLALGRVELTEAARRRIGR